MRPMIRGRAGGREGAPARARLQRRAFAALYGPGARVYDRFTAVLFAGEWARWQRLALAHLPDRGVVLELGCGTGRLAAEGAATGGTWIGLDASPAMLRVAGRRPGRAGRRPHFLLGDARRLPVRDGGLVAVLATFPTRSLLAPETQAELRRAIVPGGRLVVVISGELAPDDVGRRLRVLALRAFYGRGREGEIVPPFPFAPPGFSGGCRWVATAHGRALMYSGTRDPT